MVKKNISTIQTEIIHNETTHRKRLISADENHEGNIATMNYAWLEPGKQLTPHAHSDGEEFYYILEGEGSMLVGDDWMTIKKGDFVTVPYGANHSLKNLSQTKLVFLTVRTVKT